MGSDGGRSCAAKDKYSSGENLAKCFDNAEATVNAWIKSKVYDKVLRRDYQHLEIVVGEFKPGCNVIVAHFGRRYSRLTLEGSGLYAVRLNFRPRPTVGLRCG